MQIDTHIDIDAPPERVWGVLVDFERYGDWNPFIHPIAGEPREGAALRVTVNPPGADPMRFKPVVLDAQPPRAFAWRGTYGAGWLFSGEHRFRLEPLAASEPGGPARTRFHHGEAFGGLLLPLLRRSLDTDTRAGFDAMNRALKARAEAAP